MRIHGPGFPAFGGQLQMQCHVIMNDTALQQTACKQDSNWWSARGIQPFPTSARTMHEPVHIVAGERENKKKEKKPYQHQVISTQSTGARGTSKQDLAPTSQDQLDQGPHHPKPRTRGTTTIFCFFVPSQLSHVLKYRYSARGTQLSIAVWAAYLSSLFSFPSNRLLLLFWICVTASVSGLANVVFFHSLTPDSTTRPTSRLSQTVSAYNGNPCAPVVH